MLPAVWGVACARTVEVKGVDRQAHPCADEDEAGSEQTEWTARAVVVDEQPQGDVAGRDEQRPGEDEVTSEAHREGGGPEGDRQIGSREDGEDQPGLEGREAAALLEVEREHQEEGRLAAPEGELGGEARPQVGVLEQDRVEQWCAAAGVEPALRRREVAEQHGRNPEADPGPGPPSVQRGPGPAGAPGRRARRSPAPCPARRDAWAFRARDSGSRRGVSARQTSPIGTFMRKTRAPAAAGDVGRDEQTRR